MLLTNHPVRESFPTRRCSRFYNDTFDSGVQVAQLAALAGPMADLLHCSGLQCEALEAGWLGWLLLSRDTLLINPSVVMSLDHATAMLLSTLRYMVQGKLHVEVSGEYLVQAQHHVPRDIKEVCNQGCKILSGLSMLPALRQLTDFDTLYAGLTAKQLNETYNYCASLALPVDLETCINAAGQLSSMLFPLLVEEIDCSKEGEISQALCIADQLRQQLLKDHLQQFSYNFKSFESKEALVIAESMLEHLRMYAYEQQEPGIVRAYGDSQPSYAAARMWASEHQMRACLRLCATTLSPRNGMPAGYWCSMASALVSNGDHDVCAECISELADLIPSASVHESHQQSYPHQLIAIEIRQYVVAKLFNKVKIDKQAFMNFVEKLHLALLHAMRGEPPRIVPQSLVGVDLHTLLLTCDATLNKLLTSEHEPAFVWAESKVELDLIEKFVGDRVCTSLTEERKKDFTPLLDHNLNPDADETWILLQESHSVCEHLVRACGPELSTLSLDGPAAQVPSVVQLQTKHQVVPKLIDTCKRIASQLRAAGQWQTAARLQRIKTTPNFLGAAAEQLSALGEVFT